jgi:HEAT repeat protein
MLKEEPDWLVRKEVIVALGTIQGTNAIPMLVAEIEQAKYGEHLAALDQLRKNGETALPPSLKLAKGAKPQTRADAASLLGSIATQPAVEALATLMGDQDPLVRQRATACFKKIPGAVKMIVPALGDDGKEPDAALESDGPAARGTEPL